MTPCLIRIPPTPFRGKSPTHFLWPFVPPSAADSRRLTVSIGRAQPESDGTTATGPERLPASSPRMMQERGIPRTLPHNPGSVTLTSSLSTSAGYHRSAVTFLHRPCSPQLLHAGRSGSPSDSLDQI